MDGMREAGGQCACDTDAVVTVLQHHLCVSVEACRVTHADLAWSLCDRI